MKQKIWYHGTTRKNAQAIKKTGFKAGSWFARHMEDAIAFGGPYVFSVQITFDNPPMQWQVCCSNELPPSIIQDETIMLSKSKVRK